MPQNNIRIIEFENITDRDAFFESIADNLECCEEPGHYHPVTGSSLSGVADIFIFYLTMTLVFGQRTDTCELCGFPDQKIHG